MSHKTCGFIFGSLLAITTTINSFATLSDAEKAFYKEHQNAFAQKVFVDEPQEKLTRPLQLFIDTIIFFSPLLVSTWINALSSDSKYCHDCSLWIQTAEGHLTIKLLLGALLTWLYVKHQKANINEKTIQAFLDQYHSNLEYLSDDNLKRYLPQDLVATFDVLFYKCQRIGKAYFDSEEFRDLVKAIQGDIIKNNQTTLKEETNKKLLIITCVTAVILIAINATIFDKVQYGLHRINENFDYWGMRNSLAQSTHRPLCL